jgi:hypothetical protein
MTSAAFYAQRTYVGLFPEFAINFKVNQNWKLTGKVESQHRTFSDDAQYDNTFRYDFDRTDLQFFAARNLTTRTKVAVGYQYRFNGFGQNSHRTIQQIGWLSNLRSYRLGHRVRADQTFLDEGISWRLRYRLSSDIALKGQQLDPGEKYLIVSDELISELLNNEFGIENRLVVGLGWYFLNKHKFETAIDYRIDPIVDSPQRNRVWLKFSFYLNL